MKGIKKILSNKYNKPYLWTYPERFPQKVFLDYRGEKRKTRSLIFIFGLRLPCDTGNPNLSITLQDPKDYDLELETEAAEERLLTYDVLPNNSKAPIVNQRVLDLLTKYCPNDIQAFPVVIRNENPKLPDFDNHDYFLINITRLVDAIDKKNSKLTYYDTENVNSIKKLRLKENCLPGYSLARIKGYEPLEMVSPNLVSLFKKEKITGVKFEKDYEAYPDVPSLGERLISLYKDDPQHARTYLVQILNDSRRLAELKEELDQIPLSVLEGLVRLMLAKSQFHKKECEDLINLRRKNLRLV